MCSFAVKSVAVAGETLCLVQEAARRRVLLHTGEERAWVPRRDREAWLGLVRELELLAQPLAFSRAHDDLTISDDRQTVRATAAAVERARDPEGSLGFGGPRPALCRGVMRAGIGNAEQVRIAKGFQKLDPATQTASQNLRDGYIPGDLGFDPLNIARNLPATEKYELQEAEMLNGRVAMLALTFYAAWEVTTGTPVISAL